MKRRIFFWCIAIAPLILGNSVIQAEERRFNRRIRFTLTFINPLDRPLGTQRFWCYLPASSLPTQRLHDVQVSVPHRLHDDAWGHRVLELSFEGFPALAQKVVTVTTDVELNPAATHPPLRQAREWLAPERFIESEDPRIRGLASELKRATASATVRAAYDWVVENLSYAGYLAEDLGAVHALLERRGDCTEYANLVVALSRANAIPARMVGGYVIDRDFAPRPQDYHNWAEVYLDGAWRVVDAQKRTWFASPGEYVAFRIYRDQPSNPVGSAHRYRIQGDLRVTI